MKPARERAVAQRMACGASNAGGSAARKTRGQGVERAYIDFQVGQLASPISYVRFKARHRERRGAVLNGELRASLRL